MPDFERIIRSLSLYKEEDPVKKAQREAYYKGQSDARKEIAILFGILAALFVFGSCFTS